MPDKSRSSRTGEAPVDFEAMIERQIAAAEAARQDAATDLAPDLPIAFEPHVTRSAEVATAPAPRHGEPREEPPTPEALVPEVITPETLTTYDRSAAKPEYHDHRDRLRAKLDRRGADAFEDYELLELILFQVIPRVDTRPIAKRLIKHFGSLAEVVAAPPAKMTAVDGIGPAAARHLKLLHQVGVRIGQSSVLNRPVLSSWNALLDYCRAAMQFEGREQFRVLFLDKKNRLLADEVMSQGTVDRAAVYPREIVRRALVHDSTAIILAHNHPSGDPTPSPQDVELTNEIVQTCKSIRVTVHDHLVVGREDVVSFKMLGLM